MLILLEVWANEVGDVGWQECPSVDLEILDSE